MPKDVSKKSTLSIELAPYTATFTGRGFTLAGEEWSNGEFTLTVSRTAGSVLVAVAHGQTVKDAANDAAAHVGIPGSPVFP
jgi:hypothetical protein